MPRVKRTYWDNNPEDWNCIDDFWTWLQTQPVDVWLLWARNANWDNATDIFEKIVDHPNCPFALAAWLFWSGSNAGYYYNRPDEYTGSIFELIVKNVERGCYTNTDLYLDWRHNITGGISLLKAMKTHQGEGAYRLPRQLLGPYFGKKAQLPLYDKDTKLDVADFMYAMDGYIDESESAYQENQRLGKNFEILEKLNLPTDDNAARAVKNAKNSIDALEALYGRAEDYDVAGKKLYQEKYGNSQDFKKALLITFAIGAMVIVGAMIAHRVREGHW